MSTYFSLPTETGEAKMANALALGIPLKFTHMAVGDGNGVLPVPDRKQTALVREQRRAPINTLTRDPKNPGQIIVEQVLPANVGGWWVREIGIYDQAGDLCAVANCPPSFKPLLSEGAGKDQIIRVVLMVTSTAAVELKIDPAVVLATRKHVDDAVVAYAAPRQHTHEDLATRKYADETVAAYAAPKKHTHEELATRLYAEELLGAHERHADPHPQYALNRDKLAALLGNASEARPGLVRLASSEDAEAGTDDTRSMTPLKVWKAISRRLVQATDAAPGVARIATQAQVNAGADDTTIVTPRKLRAGFGAYFNTAAGYFMFPTWLGGLILQWGQGYVSHTAGAPTGWAFPVAFPTELLTLQVTNAHGYSTAVVSFNSASQASFNVFASVAYTNVFWFAIGR